VAERVGKRETHNPPSEPRINKEGADLRPGPWKKKERKGVIAVHKRRGPTPGVLRLQIPETSSFTKKKKRDRVKALAWKERVGGKEEKNVVERSIRGKGILRGEKTRSDLSGSREKNQGAHFVVPKKKELGQREAR